MRMEGNTMGTHIIIGVICTMVGLGAGFSLMAIMSANGYDQKMNEMFKLGYEKGVKDSEKVA